MATSLVVKINYISTYKSLAAFNIFNLNIIYLNYKHIQSRCTSSYSYDYVINKAMTLLIR